MKFVPRKIEKTADNSRGKESWKDKLKNLISVVGVLIFSALIAYDTQRLKMTYYALGGDQAAMAVATGFGALSLFINFVNLFQFLLALLGGRE